MRSKGEHYASMAKQFKDLSAGTWQAQDKTNLLLTGILNGILALYELELQQFEAKAD